LNEACLEALICHACLDFTHQWPQIEQGAIMTDDDKIIILSGVGIKLDERSTCYKGALDMHRWTIQEVLQIIDPIWVHNSLEWAFNEIGLYCCSDGLTDTEEAQHDRRKGGAER